MHNTKELLRRIKRSRTDKGRVLFVGQAYYNAWYLSRELQKIGWDAHLINFDENPASQMHYHGEDYRFSSKGLLNRLDQLVFYAIAAFYYDIFFFANAHLLQFGTFVPRVLRIFGEAAEIRLLKRLGKRIFYANNGCLDGVSQTSFSQWKPYNVCSICPWQNRPDICSDERNLAWGELRNRLADYQCTVGGNRADYNDDPRVHEVPWFYCLDKEVWNPNLRIPAKYSLPIRKSTIKLYHAVGNFASRTHGDTIPVNIKSTHIYLPLVERLKGEGFDVELIFYTDVPNTIVRYYQAQADIFLDMLTFGWFGANIREAMMLGKPAICFLRPEWIEMVRQQLPAYVEELPVISATPETVYDVLRDLIEHPEKRAEIGRRSRAFAEKWHASDEAAAHFDRVFQGFLSPVKGVSDPSGVRAKVGRGGSTAPLIPTATPS